MLRSIAVAAGMLAAASVQAQAKWDLPTAYPATNFLLYADAKRFVDPSNTCGTAPVTATRAVRNRRTITVKKAITCNAASNLAYDVLRSKKGLTIIGHVGPEACFRAEIKPNGSKLTYDRSACRAAAAPR